MNYKEYSILQRAKRWLKYLFIRVLTSRFTAKRLKSIINTDKRMPLRHFLCNKLMGKFVRSLKFIDPSQKY